MRVDVRVCVQVQQVFDDMYTAGLQPNIMTYITLLSSYAQLGSWQSALHVLDHLCQPQVSSLALPPPPPHVVTCHLPVLLFELVTSSTMLMLQCHDCLSLPVLHTQQVNMPV